jgi:hypothetical protein
MNFEQPKFEPLSQEDTLLVQDTAEKLARANLLAAEVLIEQGDDTDAAHDRVIDAWEELDRVEKLGGVGLDSSSQ